MNAQPLEPCLASSMCLITLVVVITTANILVQSFLLKFNEYSLDTKHVLSTVENCLFP